MPRLGEEARERLRFSLLFGTAPFVPYTGAVAEGPRTGKSLGTLGSAAFPRVRGGVFKSGGLGGGRKGTSALRCLCHGTRNSPKTLGLLSKGGSLNLSWLLQRPKSAVQAPSSNTPSLPLLLQASSLPTLELKARKPWKPSAETRARSEDWLSNAVIEKLVGKLARKDFELAIFSTNEAPEAAPVGDAMGVWLASTSSGFCNANLSLSTLTRCKEQRFGDSISIAQGSG